MARRTTPSKKKKWPERLYQWCKIQIFWINIKQMKKVDGIMGLSSIGGWVTEMGERLLKELWQIIRVHLYYVHVYMLQLTLFFSHLEFSPFCNCCSYFQLVKAPIEFFKWVTNKKLYNLKCIMLTYSLNVWWIQRQKCANILKSGETKKVERNKKSGLKY